MTILWKLPIVFIGAVLGSIVLLSASSILFDDPGSGTSYLAAPIGAYTSVAKTFSEFASDRKYFWVIFVLFHYFSLSILTAIIGELGFWSTFNPVHKPISRLIHFLFWPIAPIWHYQFYSIFKDFATKLWKGEHIPYKSVIWAYWASIGYFYLFWVLTVSIAIYLGAGP